MLKTLWRKLGAELWQPSRSSDSASVADAYGYVDKSFPDGFRILPHITHTGEFHLERLTRLLQQRYGKQIEKPDSIQEGDDAIRDMISFAVRIQDQDVQRELLLFYLNCSPVIQEYLRHETDLGEGPLLNK